ncbi:hypothetical protein Arub01_19630 [Actinomadura rubrobrunea]|uniref:DUF2637 domain-containing protein n=1 Tax=Actinomadura rubrobrunea TaxID=115335 RepID=A0A9W6PSG3_9ACTN|nr:DUF2637 domain-containing protein [Actinomadura rubrobrunea]GLW63719.1 hypothetical protein Arub01_19630 [Actinomadura rubrobrunea]
MSRLLGAVADSGPVIVLAGIAAAGSFTHIRDTAIEHGQGGWMAWAVAVCIDLTCVMAARERQRDKRTGRPTGRLSWPTIVLVGGILLSLAANLAQAEPSAWGWITAATPAAAFLVAVSMLERRAALAGARARTAATPVLSAPPSFGRPSSTPSPSAPSSSGSSARPSTPSSSSSPDSTGGDAARPGLAVVGASGPDQDDTRDRNQDGGQDGEDQEDGAQDNGGQTALPVPAPSGRRGRSSSPAGPLLEFARQVAAEHQATHGRPITRDALRARLGVSNQLASDLLRQIRNQIDDAA